MNVLFGNTHKNAHEICGFQVSVEKCYLPVYFFEEVLNFIRQISVQTLFIYFILRPKNSVSIFTILNAIMSLGGVSAHVKIPSAEKLTRSTALRRASLPQCNLCTLNPTINTYSKVASFVFKQKMHIETAFIPVEMMSRFAGNCLVAVILSCDAQCIQWLEIASKNRGQWKTRFHAKNFIHSVTRGEKNRFVCNIYASLKLPDDLSVLKSRRNSQNWTNGKKSFIIETVAFVLWFVCFFYLS